VHFSKKSGNYSYFPSHLYYFLSREELSLEQKIVSIKTCWMLKILSGIIEVRDLIEYRIIMRLVAEMR
jgi:hypothetical protein